MNKQSKLYKTTLAAMFSALIYVATAFLMIPLPGNGYAHLGDCFVIVSALILGPVYGAAAAGIGSAISDLFLGYGLYAPATIVIKALMAVVAAILYKGIKKTGFRYDFISVAVVALLAEIIMVIGYFAFESCIYGVEAAVVNILGNTVQGLVGLVTGTIMFSTLNKSGVISRIVKDR